MVEQVVGCKWSLTVLGLIMRGINRPGAMERSVPGLTAKVLNERLRKLLRFGIISRHEYPEIPPRVEYRLTGFGQRFAKLVADIEQLQQDLDAPAGQDPGPHGA
jgi:DNA-binding HxlR family transcriptional regulator